MLRYLKLLPLFVFGIANAQEEVVHSVYFDVNKYNLDDNRVENLVKFIKESDSSRVESISIFGYCDDRGKEEYNFKLSNNRANAIRDKLVEEGVKNKIIVTIEGRGRVLIEDDIDNIHNDVTARVTDDHQRAADSPWPKGSDALSHVYFEGA